MKLTATVMGERQTSPAYLSKTEPYAVADVLIDGDPALIASSLRALADAIDPAQLAHWEVTP